MVYCITYELKSTWQNYTQFYEAIKSSGVWWHQSGNIWFISSSNTAIYIRDYLKTFMADGDKIFVIKCDKNWAGFGYNQDEYDWLKSNL
jgi:hypothetical protein